MFELTDGAVEELISQRYRELGHKLGWRYLYCPRDVRMAAKIATLGLNPGGGKDARVDWKEKIEFSSECGNSYEVEGWSRSGERNPLQIQILEICKILNTLPRNVLSANIVPFRSSDWRSLSEKDKSLHFGISLLPWLLGSPRLRLVVMFGLRHIERKVSEAMGAKLVDDIDTGWGATRARFYRSDRLTLVSLPHLSRFRVFGRPQAEKLEDYLRAAAGQA